MEMSPSWEEPRGLSNQKPPKYFMESKGSVSYSHSPTLHPILSQMNPVHATAS
jgi:hypothetical protein